MGRSQSAWFTELRHKPSRHLPKEERQHLEEGRGMSVRGTGGYRIQEWTFARKPELWCLESFGNASENK